MNQHAFDVIEMALKLQFVAMIYDSFLSCEACRDKVLLSAVKIIFVEYLFIKRSIIHAENNGKMS